MAEKNIPETFMQRIALSFVFFLSKLQKYQDYFLTSELQFGFKVRQSTHMYTMILKETLK